MTNASYTMIIPVYPEPKFSIGVFFIIISAIMVLSAVSFALLHYLPYYKRARVKEPTVNDMPSVPENVPLKRTGKSPDDAEQTPDYEEGTNNINLVTEHAHHVRDEKTPTNFAKPYDYAFVCLITGWISALMFGFSFSLLPFAALPYGNRAYSLAERLGKLSFPMGALLTIFYSPRSYVLAGVMTLVALASLSPFPPLATSAIGEILVVCKGHPWFVNINVIGVQISVLINADDISLLALNSYLFQHGTGASFSKNLETDLSSLITLATIVFSFA